MLRLVCLKQRWHKIWFFRKNKILGNIFFNPHYVSPLLLLQIFKIFLFLSDLYRSQHVVARRPVSPPRTSKELLILGKTLPLTNCIVLRATVPISYFGVKQSLERSSFFRVAILRCKWLTGLTLSQTVAFSKEFINPTEYLLVDREQTSDIPFYSWPYLVYKRTIFLT